MALTDSTTMGVSLVYNGAVPHVRLTPCVQNTRAEIATVLRELQALAS